MSTQFTGEQEKKLIPHAVSYASIQPNEVFNSRGTHHNELSKTVRTRDSPNEMILFTSALARQASTTGVETPLEASCFLRGYSWGWVPGESRESRRGRSTSRVYVAIGRRCSSGWENNGVIFQGKRRGLIRRGGARVILFSAISINILAYSSLL